MFDPLTKWRLPTKFAINICLIQQSLSVKIYECREDVSDLEKQVENFSAVENKILIFARLEFRSNGDEQKKEEKKVIEDNSICTNIGQMLFQREKKSLGCENSFSMNLTNFFPMKLRISMSERKNAAVVVFL